MSLFSSLLEITAAIGFLAIILFVIFGQLTVRKLRKNPETKNELGIEFMSGWDIFNVAGALALPRWLNRKFKKSSLSAISANAELLEKHTNLFDKVLAVLFYVLWVVSVVSMLVLIALEKLGMFD